MNRNPTLPPDFILWKWIVYSATKTDQTSRCSLFFFPSLFYLLWFHSKPHVLFLFKVWIESKIWYQGNYLHLQRKRVLYFPPFPPSPWPTLFTTHRVLCLIAASYYLVYMCMKLWFRFPRSWETEWWNQSHTWANVQFSLQYKFIFYFIMITLHLLSVVSSDAFLFLIFSPVSHTASFCALKCKQFL